MSLVVVNASGPITTTLPLISSVPGRIITIKDSGSASATNTITIVTTAGNTFETGVASYVLNTPLAYATFIGNATTLTWRVLGITNPDVPQFTSTIVNSNTGVLSGAGIASLNTLTVSGQTNLGITSSGNLGVSGNANVSGVLSVGGQTILGNTSNTGTLGVAGTTTVGRLATTSGFAQVTNLAIQESRGICFDPSGNMYVNTSTYGTIYKITPQGVTSLLAGTYGINGITDGTGSAAVFIDSMQQMIYDSYTGCIITTNRTTLRLITLTGVVTTIASGFTYLSGVCSDGAGNFYVSDLTSGLIRKVTISSTTPTTNSASITTIAGTGTNGYYNATGTAASFNNPYHLVMNSSKTVLYVPDLNNNVIRQITLPGYVVTTYAGAIGSSATPGNTTAPATGTTDSTTPGSVQFNGPLSMTIDASNNLYIGDYFNNRIRFINASPFYTLTLAGNGGTSNVAGVGANSQIYGPHGMTIDPYGSLWIVTYFNGSILNYNLLTGYLSIYYEPTTNIPRPNNIQNTAISTIVAPAITTPTIFGSGFTVTNSNAANPGGATYQSPNGVLMDSQNNLYVGDNRRLRKISPSRLVTSIYGDVTNTQGTTQTGTAVQGVSNILYQSMCFDNSGNMYISQYAGNSILKLNLLTGVATTLSITVGSGSLALNGPNGLLFNNNTLYVMNQNPGNSENSYLLSINLSTNTSSKMAGNDGTFNYAFSICFDLAKTNIYVSNYGGTNIKIVNISNNAVTTFATSGLAGLTPLYITIDNLGNFYCSGTYTGIPVTRGIIKITSAGVASSFCNTVTINGASVNLNAPQGLAVDSYNNVYFADAGLYIVGYVTPAGTASLYSGVSGTSGTQDSTYASSITLMAPYVGINTSNPTAALHVNGTTLISGQGYLALSNTVDAKQLTLVSGVGATNYSYQSQAGDSVIRVESGGLCLAGGNAAYKGLRIGGDGNTTFAGSVYLPLGTVGIGISAQSFTTEPNIENTLNNAPSNGMGKTTGFPGLSTYSGSNQQPLQITGYYGINFVGGTGNWITGASHMSIVDGKVGIQQKNPQYALDVNGTLGVAGVTTITGPGGYGTLKIHTTNTESGVFIRDPGASDNTGWVLGTSPNFGSSPSTTCVLARFNANSVGTCFYFASNGLATFPTMTVNGKVNVVGTQLTDGVPAVYSDVFVSLLTSVGSGTGNRSMIEIGATNTTTGNFGSPYKYLMGFSNVPNGPGGNFIIQSVYSSGNYNTSATTTLFTLNNTGATFGGSVNVNYNNSSNILSGALNLYGSASYTGIGMRLFVDHGGTSIIEYKNAAGFYIYNAAVSGVYLANGSTSWSAVSDERLKENITPIVNALDFCASLRTVKYSLIRENLSTPNKIGFIAQDFVNEYSEVINIDRNNNLALAYTETIPIAFAAIKEQKIIVDAQASTITTLQTDSLTQASTIAGLQGNQDTQASTIAGLQTTIAEILAKI